MTRAVREYLTSEKEEVVNLAPQQVEDQTSVHTAT